MRYVILSILSKALRKAIDWQLSLWVWVNRHEKFLKEQSK